MTATAAPADPLVSASAADVRRAVERRLRRMPDTDPADVADAVMAVVGPVLQARDGEITRLREEAVLGPVPPGALL